jgi:transposase
MLATLEEKDAALHARDETIRQYRIRNEHLTHEIALLKRHTFGKRSESGGGLQYRLLDELVDEDIVAVETELELLAQVDSETPPRKRTPKRQARPGFHFLPHIRFVGHVFPGGIVWQHIGKLM